MVGTEDLDVSSSYLINSSVLVSHSSVSDKVVSGNMIAGTKADGTLFAVSRFHGFLEWAVPVALLSPPNQVQSFEGSTFLSTALNGTPFFLQRFIFLSNDMLSLQYLWDVESKEIVQTFYASLFSPIDFSLSENSSLSFGLFYDRLSIWETSTGHSIAEIAVTGNDSEREQGTALTTLLNGNLSIVGMQSGLAIYGNRESWDELCAIN